MTFWDGSDWVPDSSVGRAAKVSPAHRVAATAAEALLLALVVMAFLIAISSMVSPAKFAAGVGDAAAAGKETFTLTYTGFRVWQEPYAYADFTVTRSKVDGTDVWVKAHCVDASGAQAIAGADPYAHVKWDRSDPLVGYAAMDSVKNGTTCDVWLTRSFKAAEAAPGWPSTDVDVSW